VAFRSYLSLFIADRPLASILALSLYYFLPFNFGHSPFYPCDMPSLLFVTVGLFLIATRRWPAFYVLFVIATLNRETSILLTVVTGLVLFDTDARTTAWKHLAGQVSIWAVLKFALFEVYRNNPVHGQGAYGY